MPRPPRYASDLDLLNAVREQVATDPTISQAELRARVGGTQSVVSAAMRAALVEIGLLQLQEGDELDPRFARLVRCPEPAPALDLRAGVPAELSKNLSDYITGIAGVLDQMLERLHQTALAAIDEERADARRRVHIADQRAARAEEYVDGLRCDIAEAAASIDRVIAESSAESGAHKLELLKLTNGLEEFRARNAHVESVRAAAFADRDAAAASLAETRKEAATHARAAAVAEARAQELAHRVADLAERLTHAEVEVSAAREAESTSRAAAAAARATADTQLTIIARLEATLTSMSTLARARRSAAARDSKNPSA